MKKYILNTKEKTVSFITLGCKVNQYDSDAMRTLFIKNGYKVAESDTPADVYVVNTCSVTSIGDRNEVRDVMAVKDFENLTVDAEGEVKTRAFIKVQEGCDNYCTFCIIPYARGRLKSRKQKDAIEEIKHLVDRGYREVVLTGIHLGNYGKDLHDGTSLSSLVNELLKIPDLLRIRLGSIESVELSEELIHLMNSEPRVCFLLFIYFPIHSGQVRRQRRIPIRFYRKLRKKGFTGYRSWRKSYQRHTDAVFWENRFVFYWKRKKTVVLKGFLMNIYVYISKGKV